MKHLSPELASRILAKDRRIGSRCRRCMFKIGLYTFTVGWYRQCPNCLKRRIEAVIADGEPLEGELEYTYHWVCTDVDRQERLFFGELTVELPRFFRCARCDAVKLMERAKYYFQEGKNSSPPYCANCSEWLHAQDQR